MKSLRLKGIGLTALFTAMIPSLSAETVWLSSLDLNQMTAGWSVPKADREITGQPIVIAKKQFEHGVGTHAASSFRVNVGGHAGRFIAQVGVDDSAGGQGSVEFIVSGDGKILWQSGVMTGGRAAVPVDVDLTDVKILELRVTDGGDGSNNDHADWADAKIIIKDGAAKPLGLGRMKKLTVTPKNLVWILEVAKDN